MHPALSVVFFTVVSGCGYGLLFLTGALLAVEPGLFGRHEVLALLGAGFVFACAGLLASTLHLGKPLRAWRAFSQWRSSWLSREGIAAVATFVPLAGIAVAPLPPAHPALLRAGALLLVLLACVTVYCTARIYTSLKTIPAWNSGYVLPGYLLFALLGGAAWFGAVDAWFGSDDAQLRLNLALIAAIAGAAAAVIKRAYWNAIDAAPARSTSESATGLGRFGTVRPAEAPHTEANYLTREMGFVLARKHAARLRLAAIVLFALAPLLVAAVIFFAPAAPWPLASLAAAAAVTAGSFVERWLFFAEARHVVMLYYATAPVTATS